MSEYQFTDLRPEDICRAVVRNYDLPAATTIRLLKYSENLTYLLTDPVSGMRRVLRVFRPGYHRPSEMEGELIWIHHILQDTKVITADVYLDRHGAFVSPITIDGRIYHCALFAYVDGVRLDSLSREEHLHYLEQMGEIMAQLHQQVIHWPASASLDRFSWDLEDLIGENARWGQFTLMQGLPDTYMPLYRQAAQIIRERVEAYGRSRDRYGLIHDDISINNVLLCGDEICLLDFDDCGKGWFLYDLPSALLEEFGQDLEDGLDAVLRGYERYRPLTAEDLAEIPTFVMLKKIVRIGWMATRAGNDAIKRIRPDYCENTAHMAYQYIATHGQYIK